jgi:polar amino acid transport system permease protein
MTPDPGVVLQASDWAFVLQNSEFLARGLLVTAGLTLTSILLGFLAGFPAGAIEVYGSGRTKKAVEVVGVVLRGTPIVVILVYVFFVFPLNLSAFAAATIGLGMRSAAYQAQIFRGSLKSVSSGQMEAARSVGLSKLEALRYVVVPQALRRSIPGFQNEFTIVLKDTSVAFAIGLGELLTRGFNLFTQPGKDTAVLEVFLAISLVYFVLTFTTNRALDALGDRFAVPGGGR